MVKHGETGLSRAGAEAAPSAHEYAGKRGNGDPVHVLVGSQPAKDLLRIDLAGEGTQHQDPVDRLIAVDAVHLPQQLRS